VYKISTGGVFTRWLLFYFQRIFLTKKVRSFAWSVVKCLVVLIRKHDTKESQGRANDELNNRGLLQVGRLLSEDQVKEVFEFLANKHVYDPYGDDQALFLPPLSGGEKSFHVAHHNTIDIVNAPHLLKLANDERILEIASDFLGTRPTIGYMAAWWSFPTANGPMHAENFHRDVDDWKFIKLFVALTDFSSTSGPHVYVIGSSNSKKGRQSIRRFDDDEIVALFGQSAIKYMTPKAGEAFFEDTFGFHKGQPVSKGFRLIFQVTYSVFALPYSPAQPVKITEGFDNTYDQWINRLYLSD
jgi:hypothetical protein